MARRRRRPRGYIEELPSGSFRAVVYAGIDPLTRKLRYLRETAKTYDAAELALTKLQRQVDEERHPKTAITVRQAITQWLEVADLADTTRERYEDLIRLYVLPVFGNVQAAKLDAEVLERFYARLQRCRELCAGRARQRHRCRPLSGSTTRKIHYIIRGALSRAVRWRYLGVNKAALAVAPSPNATEPDPPSPEEAAAILNDAWRDPEWGLLLWLTMVTGCRRGELCALVWADVEIDQAVLRLPASIAHTKAGLKKKPTKTNKGRRVALDPHTVALLIDHRQRWEQRCTALGCELTGDTHLFSPAPDGSTPFVPRSITQRYRRMATKLRLRSTRLHSLRHYSATELIAAGVDIRTVAGRLGHGGGGATTLKVYAAWVDHADRRAATTMADIMPTPIPTPRGPRGPYEQIAAELRQAIVSRSLEPGSRLPTVVEIAAKYRVAAGTAHRAIASLRSEGLIEVSRGRRATVRASHGTSPQHVGI
jgi:integrase